MGDKKDTMFPWINYEPRTLPTREQKEQYPNLNNVYDFPPNCNVYGSFDVNETNQSIRIGRIEVIDDYGYDISQCNWAIGTYSRTL